MLTAIMVPAAFAAELLAIKAPVHYAAAAAAAAAAEVRRVRR